MKNNILLLCACLFTACQSTTDNATDIKNTAIDTIKQTESIKKVIEPNYSSSFYKCTDSSIHIDVCLEHEFEKQDKLLNIAYNNAKKEIQPFRIESFIKVQRLWIKYRDLKCDFYYHKESGSGGFTDSQECLLNMTIHRTLEIKNIF